MEGRIRRCDGRGSSLERQVFYITFSVPASYNTTPFQRVWALSTKFDLTVLTLFRPECIGLLRGVRFVTCPWGHIRFAGRYLFPFWCLHRLLITRRPAFRPVVVTTFQPMALLAGLLARFVLRMAWVADVFDVPLLELETMGVRHSFLHRFKRILLKLQDLLLVRHAINRADLVLCTLVPEALARYEIPEERVLCLTNGVDLRLIKQASAELPAEAGNNRLNVVYVGYVLRIRGIDTVLQAAAMLRYEFPHIRWVLVGPSTDEDSLWLGQQISALGLTTTVEWVGKVPHEVALAWIARAHVCLFPFPRNFATDYIYPVKLFEYMALGKPVIASDLKGVRKVLGKGEAGLLVEPGDAVALADAVRRLARDPSLRMRMSREAYQVVADYDWKAVNERVVNALRRVR